VKSGHWPRGARTAVIAIDYVIGAAACTTALFGTALLMKAARPAVTSRFDVLGPVMARVAPDALLLVVGFILAQLVSTAAFCGLDTALGSDWKIARKWRYILLAPPFVICLPLALGAPGLVLGSVAHLGSLYVGWRWTDQPPRTPYWTLKHLLREGRNTSAHDAETASGSLFSRKPGLKAAVLVVAWGLLATLSASFVVGGIIEAVNGTAWRIAFSLVFAPIAWLASVRAARARRPRVKANLLDEGGLQ
jgi:hypothetical protein